MVLVWMGWFQAFATDGLYFPAFMIAFGSVVILRAPSTKILSENEIRAIPVWMQGLARLNSERLQRRGGWTIIGSSVLIGDHADHM